MLPVPLGMDSSLCGWLCLSGWTALYVDAAHALWDGQLCVWMAVPCGMDSSVCGQLCLVGWSALCVDAARALWGGQFCVDGCALQGAEQRPGSTH